MSSSPFPIRGVVEGFYGVFYTFPERDELIRFIGRHGYNLYIYGPKNDRQHRARWWEPYPAEVLDQFAATIATARAAGVTFCYAIAPISYAAPEDFERMTAKLQPFYDMGVRCFSIFMDDIMPESALDGDDKGYQHYAELHLEICNRLYDWLQELSPACSLSMCPIDYHGSPPFSNYLRLLGEGLRPAIDIFYTGPQICSPAIGAGDAAEVGEVLRRPPLIWDNYPANDLAMRSELHIGPISSRDPELAGAVRGVVVNPMNQPEASKIALLTYTEYLRDPGSYDPAAAWERALREIGGRSSYDALRQFAETALYSCLNPTDAPYLDALVQATLLSLGQGRPFAGSAAAQALGHHLNSLDESCYHLKNRMANLPLREDLLPWIEALEDWIWLGKRALQTLELLASGGAYERPYRQLEQSLAEIRAHNKRSGGRALLPLAEFAREQAEQRGVHRPG